METRPRYKTKGKKCIYCTVFFSDLPAYGCVQTPLFASYLVRNRTLQVQEVEVTVEPSDAFMYSGHKQVSSAYLLHVKHVSCEGVWWNNILEEVYYWLLRCDWPVKLQYPLPFIYEKRGRNLPEANATLWIVFNDEFLFQIQFRLLPTGDQRLKFSLYPLYAGFLTLPKLHFKLPRFQVSWDEYAQKLVPTNVFIKVRNFFMSKTWKNATILQHVGRTSDNGQVGMLYLLTQLSF